MLEINFSGMRELLKIQKEKRLSGEIKSEDLIDLQSLLSKFINLPNENEFELEEFPIEQGTRVELIGLNPILDDLLNNFNELYNYLQDVVPLHFNKEKFKWAETIEKKIQDVSPTGYFVYCNGDTGKPFFDKKLEFDIKVIPYTGDDSWIEGALKEIKKCLMGDKIPEMNPDCDFCNYRKNAVVAKMKHEKK
jgi:hypothetical protein